MNDFSNDTGALFAQNQLNNANQLMGMTMRNCPCLGSCTCFGYLGQHVYTGHQAPTTKLQLADELDAFASAAKCPEDMKGGLREKAEQLRKSHADDLVAKADAALKVPR